MPTNTEFELKKKNTLRLTPFDETYGFPLEASFVCTFVHALRLSPLRNVIGGTSALCCQIPRPLAEVCYVRATVDASPLLTFNLNKLIRSIKRDTSK